MESVLFLSGRLIDRAAQIISVNQNPAFPASNLADQRPRRVHRTLNVNTDPIDIDFGQDTEWRDLLLVNTNFASDGTIRVRVADSQSGLNSATGDNDSGFVSCWPSTGRPDEAQYPLDVTDPEYEGLPVLFRWPTPRNKRWARITYTNDGAPNGFLEIGRAIFDMGFQPIRTAVYPADLGFVPTDIQERGPSGAMNFGTRARPRFQELTLPNLRKDEAFGDLYELYRLRGQSKDIAIIRDPDETTHLHRMITHGLFAGEPKITHRRRQRYQAQIRVEEFY